MQKIQSFFACLVFCISGISQPTESDGQYPFVHYSPKDGIISNQIRNIYQDSRGRLYFGSMNGLSVYDGARFVNYNSKNGLANDVVNCVMEMGDDSIWIVTNSTSINCLVKGKIKTAGLKNSRIVINNLFRDEQANLYAASEQGLFILDKDQFIKLALTDTAGNDINTHISNILPVGDYLLIHRDNAIIRDREFRLYLYNKISGQTTAELSHIINFSVAPDGRIWVCYRDSIRALDTSAIRKGKIVMTELPHQFASLKNFGRSFLQFDHANNCWLGNQQTLLKIEPSGKLRSFSRSSGLGILYISFIFRDREGILWIATNNGGVSKLVYDNFTFLEIPPLIYPPYGDIAYNRESDEWLYFSKISHDLMRKKQGLSQQFLFPKAEDINAIITTASGIFATGRHGVYKLQTRNNIIHAENILHDSVEDMYGNLFADKNGNLIICHQRSIIAFIQGKTVFRKMLSSFADYAAVDSKGNIWVATRSNDLYKFAIRPNDPENYLDQQFHFTNDAPVAGPSPRCLVIDKEDKIWIGTRQHGIQVFHVSGDSLRQICTVTSSTGLSDNFSWHLACDSNNFIWAASPLGLDRISLKNQQPVVENLTKQNSIYQSVFKTLIDKNNVAWITTSNGLIRVSPEIKVPTSYIPTLLMSMVKTGKDTITHETNGRFNHKQNNISFHFAATTYLYEKQVMYQYRLIGGSNNAWSEPSNNSTVTFSDLPPGEYILEIKARFPAERYPEQIINYAFAIAPPWWGSWWFRSIFVSAVALLLILALRFYYRRKLEKQLARVEKQQAIEKERTRIATDMHDDLGAGLSRIKFLSENAKANKGNDEAIMEDISKISVYSNEMAEKMGEIVWALNERNDTVADLIAYTRSYTREYLSSQKIQCDLDTPIDLPAIFIPGEMRQNIFLSVKECLHNIVKHADASRVYFSVRLEKEIEIIIHDNGRGIDWDQLRPFSNGIQNIRKRMRDINGTVEFQHDSGTRVILSAPYHL